MPAESTPASSSADGKKVRRFAPEPIEHSVKRSKASESNAPANTEAPKVRRFAPQIVEQSPKAAAAVPDAKPTARRFAPQPIETTHSSSKDRVGSSTKSRFQPQSLETTSGGNRTETEKKTVRRFAPDLIDTAQRTHRAGGPGSRRPRPETHRTEDGHSLHAREHRRHITGDQTPRHEGASDQDPPSPRTLHVPGTHTVDFADLPRRPVSPLDGSAPSRSAALSGPRCHSFRCPDLDTIESSESERGSSPSSLSCSPAQGSPITASDSSFTDFYKHATRIRESVDENFAHYLLQLEAKKAEERLREQALAAFPNSDFHEPVQHYVNDDQESDDFEYEDRVVTWEGGFDEDDVITMVRRRDSTKVPWEQLEMQRHADRLAQERNANVITAARENSRSPWWNPTYGFSMHDNDSEMRSMRDRARPPMLGRDLVFPRCPSPEPARFDVTQGSTTLRKQMSSQSGSAEAKKDSEARLWTASSAKKSSSDKTEGLWGGFCVESSSDEVTGGLAPPVGPTGLMTPRSEDPNPFEQSFAAGGRPEGGLSSGGMSNGVLTTPPTPPAEPRSAPDLACIDTVLVSDYELEREIEETYTDDFVTQVFNYLSLGYPSLAKPFDEELSKISRIPIRELRKDDALARNSPRGYIRLGPDFEGAHSSNEQSVSEQNSVRWKALRLYIHEWARQEKNMVNPAAAGGTAGGQFGAVIERRGSWGI